LGNHLTHRVTDDPVRISRHCLALVIMAVLLGVEIESFNGAFCLFALVTAVFRTAGTAERIASLAGAR